jgi:hypothetical protein
LPEAESACGTERRGVRVEEFAGRVQEIGCPLDRSDPAYGGAPLLSFPPPDRLHPGVVSSDGDVRSTALLGSWARPNPNSMT